MKFGVQSCLKINTCVCLSDLLCGFQQGKKKTEFGKIKAKSTTLPRIQLVWDGRLKPVVFIWVLKSISSAECPCKVWLPFAPFMTMLMHIPFIYQNVLCCAGMSFKLLMSVAMLLQCALIVC